MAQEFFVETNPTSLTVSAIEDQQTGGISLPALVLEFRRQIPEIDSVALPRVYTPLGEAVLLGAENVVFLGAKEQNQAESVFMDTKKAAQAVLDFLTTYPGADCKIHKEHVQLIDDAFLEDLPQSFAQNVRRARNVNLHTGVYI